MSDTPLFSPELEGLLREVAADPSSVLLRVPRPTTLRSLLERQEPMRPTAAGLGALDRHLLTIHREDLAEALLGACLVRLYSNPEWNLCVHRTRTATEDWRVKSPDDWAAVMREKVEALERAPYELTGLDLLQACIEPRGLEVISLTQLARAALRLVPSARARAWIAFELRLLERTSDAIRVVDQELAHHVQPAIAASLLEYRAGALSARGEFAAASNDAWRAHAEDPGRVSVLVNALYYALCSGDGERARWAGAELDAIVSHPTEGLLQQIEVIETIARGNDVAVSSTTRSIAHAQLDSAGPLARRILRVYS